jgi:hypothetical protein
MVELFAATSGNQKAMEAFVRMNAGTISPAEFSPENVREIMSAAHARSGSSAGDQF